MNYKFNKQNPNYNLIQEVLKETDNKSNKKLAFYLNSMMINYEDDKVELQQRKVALPSEGKDGAHVKKALILLAIRAEKEAFNTDSKNHSYNSPKPKVELLSTSNEQAINSLNSLLGAMHAIEQQKKLHIAQNNKGDERETTLAQKLRKIQRFDEKDVQKIPTSPNKDVRDIKKITNIAKSIGNKIKHSLKSNAHNIRSILKSKSSTKGNDINY
jgi:hypothetical protein